jgi:hypothetical protein
MWGDRKELRDRSKQPIMPIRHHQINVGCSCVPADLAEDKL